MAGFPCKKGWRGEVYQRSISAGTLQRSNSHIVLIRMRMDFSLTIFSDYI